MKFYLTLFISVLFLLLGCKKNNNSTTFEEVANTEETTITNGIGTILSSDAKKLVENWQEYQNTEKTLEQYYSINKSDALSNAKQLSEAAQQLRDSIRVDKLKSNDFKIRLNVFYNYTLRLTDMETIAKINSEEVKTEVDNIIHSFSAINAKLNNIVQQEQLEKEVTEFQ